MNNKEKLALLRKKMSEKKIDIWIISGSDPHQSEYVAPRWRTRHFLSGFSGSAGLLVISQKEAGLWTDSRYFLQATEELKDSGFTLYKDGLPETPKYQDWIAAALPQSGTIGFDGSTFSLKQFRDLQAALSSKKVNFSFSEDILDDVWNNRPDFPKKVINEFPEKFSGESRVTKIKRLREEMKKAECSAYLLSTLDDIAWLLNIRGADIAFSPVAISYLIVEFNKIRFYIHSAQLDSNIKEKLEKDGIEICDYNSIFSDIALLKEKSIFIDPARVSQKLFDSIDVSNKVIEKPNISTRLKALKNATEIAGMKLAHIEDGVAMIRWWMWLEDNLDKIPMDEVSVAEKLEEFRTKGKTFIIPSFDTISGYNSNGAIVHYSAKKESAAHIKSEGILLLDSGGHYQTGTTDITRTFSLSQPSIDQKKHYTLVLKAHINLAHMTFPAGTNGIQLDAITRRPIWENMLNYGHGTGHGVGQYLNVHEGPQGISPKADIALEAGHILSNEPGLYFEGKYGIRIENLVVVEKRQDTPFGTFLGFETITLCPLDFRLIDETLLCKNEIKWLNDYNEKVFENLSPWLDEKESAWLKSKTPKLELK